MIKLHKLYQVIRYGVVGAFSNLFGYSLYLIITFLGLNPKIAVTLLYPLGAFLAYFAHAKYSFAYDRKNSGAFARYIMAYLIGYGVNFMMLFIFVDKFKFPHQEIQALAILCVAGILFLMLKYFVFPASQARIK